MVFALKDPLTINDLMATPIDFSKYCFNALTDKLDWNNPEGDRYPFDLSKPLPLQGPPGHQTIAADYFFNNDLEYLKTFDLEVTYTTSITKTKAARYEINGIEDTVNKFSKQNVYSTMAILGVKSVSVNKLHGYGHLEEIMVKRYDQQLYKFKEGGFVDLHLNDIEDILLLAVQHKLFHHDDDVIVDFIMALCMFTRSLILKRRVEDLQLCVESYLKKLNITKPQKTFPEIEFKEPYTPSYDPPGIVYEDLDKQKRVFELMSCTSSRMAHSSLFAMRFITEYSTFVWITTRRCQRGSGCSTGVVVYGYDGLLMHPVDPPSPDYVSGPKEPEQASLSPDYVSGPEYPEYLALSDGAARIRLRTASPPPLPLSSPLPLPPPIILPRTRASMVLMRAAAPSTYILAPRSRTPPSGIPPILPIPLPTSLLPLPLTSTDRRVDVPEVVLLPQKRLCIASGPRFKVEESSSAAAARSTGGFRADYGFVGTLDAEIRRDPDREVGYGITDVWVDPAEAAKEIPLTTLAELSQRVTDFVTTVRQDT
ncbi:hypothetical protein Tco_1037100, partial [Tanacetum coccineum]